MGFLLLFEYRAIRGFLFLNILDESIGCMCKWCIYFILRVFFHVIVYIFSFLILGLTPEWLYLDGALKDRQKKATLNESGWGTKALPVCPGPSCCPANNKEGGEGGRALTALLPTSLLCTNPLGLIFTQSLNRSSDERQKEKRWNFTQSRAEKSRAERHTSLISFQKKGLSENNPSGCGLQTVKD